MGPSRSTRRALMLGLGLVTAAVIAGTVGAQSGWTRYVNARFATGADVPRHLLPVQDRAPANGDGATFRSRNGLETLRVWGSYAAMTFTPEQLADMAMDGWKTTYRRILADGFIVSGLRSNTIAYERCRRNGDTNHCFRLEYPVARKATYDPVVTRISQSLSGG